MKLVVIRSNLREGLSVVERVVSENQNLPILKNLLIETVGGRIQLTGTNLEIATTAFVSGKIIEEGRVSVPASVISGLVANLQSERLNLESEGIHLRLKTDNYEALIQGLPVDDFPLIPKIKNHEEYLEVKGEMLREALTQTVVSAGASETRPELTCALFNFSLDNLKLAATDSFRLSEKKIAANHFTAKTANAFTALVPTKTCYELLRVTAPNDVVRTYYDGNQILFTTERFEMVSRLIDGTFPDYAAILPKRFETELVLDRQEAMQAVKLASVLSSRSSEVRVSVPDGKKTITISSAGQGVGEDVHHLTAKVNGAAREICFNWRYLLDGLKSVPGDEVFLGINEENKPALLKSPTDTSFFYVVMPVLKT